jgi:hypothetical protein
MEFNAYIFSVTQCSKCLSGDFFIDTLKLYLIKRSLVPLIVYLIKRARLFNNFNSSDVLKNSNCLHLT